MCGFVVPQVCELGHDFGVDLLPVEDAEEHLSRVQAAALRPSQQQQQTGQRLELQLQQLLQPAELLVLNQIERAHLHEPTGVITLLSLITCTW